MFHLLPKTSKSFVPVKTWTKFVPEIEKEALKQLEYLSQLPIIHSHVAVMPDVHCGKGSTIGTVIPTVSAIIPAAVGVDIGCGMCAVKTNLTANQLPQNLKKIRTAIERMVPHGRDLQTSNDPGSWNQHQPLPNKNKTLWESELKDDFKKLVHLHPSLKKANSIEHLGTLGTGNHFIELCLDDTIDQNVWIMLHSGSRGIGNKIGMHFIDLAKKDMRKAHMLQALPDQDLAYLKEGTQYFDDYVFAVGWAQKYASINRRLMMDQTIEAIKSTGELPDFNTNELVVNCHHNYVQKEFHFGKEVFVTRKGAVRASLGALGIIPGSMGEKSFIVRGKGDPQSFESCSHGAGRIMSRTQAKKHFSLEYHIEKTKDVECRKDEDVIEETVGAYKDINTVMKSQEDLVEILYTLKQVVCVKG